MSRSFNLPPVTSTYCSNPDVTHTVSSMSKQEGSGIQGYYTSEFDAKRVAIWCRNRGHTNVSVDEYDNKAVRPGIHPLVNASMGGY